nr:MAG TPA: hypothetical protein [Caudoviricetes sp.]
MKYRFFMRPTLKLCCKYEQFFYPLQYPLHMIQLCGCMVYL